MGAMATQITGVSIVYSNVCSDANQRKHLSSTSLAFVRGGGGVGVGVVGGGGVGWGVGVGVGVGWGIHR